MHPEWHPARLSNLGALNKPMKMKRWANYMKPGSPRQKEDPVNGDAFGTSGLDGDAEVFGRCATVGIHVSMKHPPFSKDNRS